MNHLVLGLVAHVDAGKTTLSEALLYRTGAIRKLGRVDHGDSQLDFSPLERQRGITIYAKQAVIEHAGTSFSLLDTPGHVDFSTEAERTMQALDYALLVIDGTSGVQSHTKTLWLGPERAVVHVGYNDRKVVRLQRANEFIFNRRFAKFRNEYPGKPPLGVSNGLPSAVPDLRQSVCMLCEDHRTEAPAGQSRQAPRAHRPGYSLRGSMKAVSPWTKLLGLPVQLPPFSKRAV